MTTWGITGGDWWAWTLRKSQEQILNQIKSLEAKLQNYTNDTLEWRQSIQAINSKVGQYKQALWQYDKLISDVESAGAEAKRGSAMKQQASQWYITSLATSKWHTWAEAAKDIADIQWAGAAQRSDIQWQVNQNVSEARWIKSNMHMSIAQQLAAEEAGGWTSSWLASSIASYWDKDKNVSPDDVNDIMTGTETETPASVEDNDVARGAATTTVESPWKTMANALMAWSLTWPVWMSLAPLYWAYKIFKNSKSK